MSLAENKLLVDRQLISYCAIFNLKGEKSNFDEKRIRFALDRETERKRDGQARVGSQFLIFQTIADSFPRARCRFAAIWRRWISLTRRTRASFNVERTNERTNGGGGMRRWQRALSRSVYRFAENRGISLLFATASRGSGLSLPLRNVFLSLSLLLPWHPISCPPPSRTRRRRHPQMLLSTLHHYN